MADFEYLRKRRSEIDHRVLVGHQVEGKREPVFLDQAKRSVHGYVVGVSGTGKSRFLESLILQDIDKGHPLCLIDPMGDLYHRVLEYIADGIEKAGGSGFSTADILPEYVFLDAESETPVRINPLGPNDVEEPEHQVDDLMAAVERLLGSLEEKVRLRNILRGVFRVTAELNRLPVAERPELPAKYRKGNSYPLNLFFAVDFLNMSDQERAELMRALPDTATLRFRRQYAEFFAANPSSEQSRLVQSSMNVFQYLLDDDMVARVLSTRHSTVHIHELLRSSQSLLCHLPIGQNLAGMSFLGRLITTKLQRAAYRRPESQWRDSYYLYLDEFHYFSDQALADSMTNLRKFGLRLVNAHQSGSQPPFDTPQGQALLETVKANSQVKVAFRLHRPDAEGMAAELFALSQKRLSHTAEDVSVGISEGRGLDLAFGFSVTGGISRSRSRSVTESFGETENFGIGRTRGTNIGQTLSRSQGGSIARSLSEAISASETRGITEAFSRTHQISVAIGDNWSQVRDHRRGLTVTNGINESLAQLEGRDHSQTHSLQRGHTQTEGRSSQSTSSSTRQQAQSDHSSVSQGTQLMQSDDGGVTFYDAGGHGVGRSSIGQSHGTGSGQGRSLAEIQGTARAEGENFSRAISQLKSIARGFTNKQAETRTSGRKLDIGESESEGLSIGEGGSHTETAGHGSGWSAGTRLDLGRSATTTKGKTETESWQRSLAEAFTLLEQFTQTYSQALQRSRSVSETVGLTEHVDHSRSQQIRQSRSRTETVSTSRRQVHHTVEGERELYVNLLQRLPSRQCFVLGEPLRPILLETPFIPDHHYNYQIYNFPEALLRLQAARLLGLQPKAEEEASGALAEKDPASEPPADVLVFASPKTPAVKEEDEDDPFLD